MSIETRPQPEVPRGQRRPYQQPTLKVFGSVAAMTSVIGEGTMMDGGPNNAKSS